MITIDISKVRWWQWLMIGALIAVGQIVSEWSYKVTVAIAERAMQ